ncbi:hypothetical protein [Asticcacaulis sp. 201]|uniref:hypothetical protein n=1 Tax=Asticcacaulis sp. 201 TaxID=3028787 RepID=UPI00291640C4|nr:hypothetical protein [Asticcacaulis sp. 201]MDV6331156.1 hypothetical protein [Asticcacaulis sp. 201]
MMLQLPSSRLLSSRPVFEWVWISCAVLVGHALLLVLLCQMGQTPVAPVGGNASTEVVVSLIATAPAREAAVKSPSILSLAVKKISTSEPASDQGLEPPKIEPEVALNPDNAEPQLSAADAVTLDQFNPASTGAPGVPCDLTATLASIFAQSPEVRQGLEGVPTSQRSVANAVMLWDGHWPETSLSGGQGLLRALLVKAVGHARPECLTQTNRGPVLFLVPEDQTTVVLAIGSGEWRWGDLLNSPVDSVIASRNIFIPTASVIQPAT